MEVDELRSFDRSLDIDNLNRALTMANTFRNAPTFARYRSAEVVHEVPISRRIEGFTLTGRIDLLGPDFVLDFKTGRKDASDRYEIQLWLYGKVTERNDLALAYLHSAEVVTYRWEDMIGTEA